MVSVKSLSDQCRHRTSIVFGNLGRWPDRVTHLDLTWDKGVELRLFQVRRPPFHRVWEAYQPQTTDAYSVDFTDCPRVADVYVKWLTWLDDWESIETNLSLGACQLAYFAHADVFHHEGKPVPTELSIATIRRDGSDPEIMCITVNHAGQTSKSKDFRQQGPDGG
ncbi:hypothetical protein TNCV_768341 [Trichonephila clavipes]|nr:hypothetical protein TNCV_768341 [Trichonephila clavipes]